MRLLGHYLSLSLFTDVQSSISLCLLIACGTLPQAAARASSAGRSYVGTAAGQSGFRARFVLWMTPMHGAMEQTIQLRLRIPTRRQIKRDPTGATRTPLIKSPLQRGFGVRFFGVDHGPLCAPNLYIDPGGNHSKMREWPWRRVWSFAARTNVVKQRQSEQNLQLCDC